MSDQVTNWVWLDNPPSVEGYQPRKVYLLGLAKNIPGFYTVADVETGKVMDVAKQRLSAPGGAA